MRTHEPAECGLPDIPTVTGSSPLSAGKFGTQSSSRQAASPHHRARRPGCVHPANAWRRNVGGDTGDTNASGPMDRMNAPTRALISREHWPSNTGRISVRPRGSGRGPSSPVTLGVRPPANTDKGRNRSRRRPARKAVAEMECPATPPCRRKGMRGLSLAPDRVTARSNDESPVPVANPPSRRVPAW